jgi:hypothetical protein
MIYIIPTFYLTLPKLLYQDERRYTCSMGKREAHIKLQSENTKGKPVGRPGRRQELNIKSDCRKIGKGRDWIQMVGDRDR